jgi:hypothetical protein
MLRMGLERGQVERFLKMKHKKNNIQRKPLLENKYQGFLVMGVLVFQLFLSLRHLVMLWEKAL